ncbi:hypothetical protein AVEN_244372-1 [Araneus ventricosus]|uniref:Uncharacterized protein n=1 Tax=Araneus ventricosus TaxID=182803 RepID=A0A4Y2RT38_ARAVE|nr:hypothetical protein AVEN_260542-1 [Araneus ventricosus]GBN78883.1 hypothetical protein AVEN_244372-1 [Araneus ventricosus]
MYKLTTSEILFFFSHFYANCDYFIPSLESGLAYSSEFVENRQINKVDEYVHDHTNLISSLIITPNIIVCYSNTSDDESCDHLRHNTPIDENTAQFPVSTHIESSVHKDRANSTNPRKPRRKLIAFSLLERTPSESECVFLKARKRVK